VSGADAARPDGAAAVEAPGHLVTIRLIGVSLEAFSHSSEHHDELFREFALIQSREPSAGHTVPGRLLALMEELTGRYGGFGAVPQSVLDAAMAQGDAVVDLVYEMPAEVRDACVHLADLLAEADQYCRDGDLLTMAPPPDAVAFRDWFLLEFVRQVDGLPPVPWPDYIAQSQ
jgi:hypothetical protein